MAGKGDKPRNCYSKEFKNNYDIINWSYKAESSFKDSNEKNLDKDEQLTCNLQNLSATE